MTSIILLILGTILFLGSLYLFLVQQARSTDSSFRYSVLGWFIATASLVFPLKEKVWKGWQKNILAVVLLAASVMCFYATWIAYNNSI